jgi:transposase
MIETFNKSVRRLRGLLAGTTYALDSTIIETKSDFPGCGMTKREKEDSKGESSKVIYGFKLFILYEVKSRIIIAMDIVPANESDSKYFLSMVKKGVKNIGKGRIKLVIADRGFLDGSQMWELKNKLGIDFIIPAKSNMIVREDAIKLRNIYEKNNINTGNWKYGKYACKGYGVEGLLSYFEYNPTGIKDNKKTNGSPVNAVVVTTWKGKPVALGKEKVLLTSLPVNVPEMVAGGYRQRSLIENNG